SSKAAEGNLRASIFSMRALYQTYLLAGLIVKNISAFQSTTHSWIILRRPFLIFVKNKSFVDDIKYNDPY
ncbi:MAG: hypothetical protein JAY75_18550, partial [Candidatus Thiodiazotropha taylori]|nr:hypothetical protein [Candidatus Thiodiazotropha taylori]MCW4310219.1 hypothetical protein [Candidatus Thiodiazotropha endolucinida]